MPCQTYQVYLQTGHDICRDYVCATSKTQAAQEFLAVHPEYTIADFVTADQFEVEPVD